MADPKSDALDVVSDFGNRSSGSVWPNLSRFDVATGLAERVQQPDKIDQKDTWLCGVAAFVRSWAENDPVAYARFGVSMFENGEGWIRRTERPSGLAPKATADRLVRASMDLRRDPNLPRSSSGALMNPADWIVLAPIRENLNLVFGYTAGEGIMHIKAWNFPWEVINCLKAAGYTTITDQTHPSGADLHNAIVASEYVSKGWQVILNIHYNMLGANAGVQGRDTFAIGPINLLPIRAPNHFVRLVTEIRRHPANGEFLAPFTVWNYGNNQPVPFPENPDGKGLWIKAFEANYYGFVAAKY
jgi:hypothetical protein